MFESVPDAAESEVVVVPGMTVLFRGRLESDGGLMDRERSRYPLWLLNEERVVGGLVVPHEVRLAEVGTRSSEEVHRG